jgi:hypothetical protein
VRGRKMGSMSTQRRATRRNQDLMGRVRVAGLSAASGTRFDHALFLGGITAPLMSILWLAWEWLILSDETSQELDHREATKSLLSDHHSEWFAGLGRRRRLLPPGRAGCTTESVPQIAKRSSLPHIPIFSARTRLRHTLPHAPAARRGGTWAERHDGKRDLYFQHAA